MATILDRIDILVTRHCGSKHGRFTCFSKMTGISKSAISNWYKRGVTSLDPENVDAICLACNVSTDWLLFGRSESKRGKKDVPIQDPQEMPADAVRVKDLGAPRKIPVLSFAQAGKLGEAGIVPDDQFPVGVADEFVDCYEPGISENAYYLRIEGRSMEPLLRMGDKVLIDPVRQPFNGAIVAAKNTETGDVVIKRYMQTGPTEVVLQSENPDFLPIVLHPDGSPVVILGVAIKMERALD